MYPLIIVSGLEMSLISGDGAKREALGIKPFRGLLHHIRMSFVQERVYTGCHMIPEEKIFFEMSHFRMNKGVSF